MTKKALIFIGLTYAISWIAFMIFKSFGIKLQSLPGVLFAVGYMFVPLISAVIIQKGIYKEPVKEPLGISFKLNKWFLFAWFIMPIIACAVLGVSLLLPGITFSPDMSGFLDKMAKTITPEQLQKAKEQLNTIPISPFLITLLMGLVYGATINAVAGFGEEAGWRGFLHKELIPMGFWKSSLFIGFIWGVWHFPLIMQGHNYPEHPTIGVFMMIVWCMLLAPIFTYTRIKTKSVIAAAVLHGTLNATAGLPMMMIRGGNDLNTGITGLPGFIVLAIVDIGIFIFDKNPAGTN